MAHQVLVVFGGGYKDDALACSMLGMTAHFRHDPSAVVTSWSNLDLATFVLEGKEMIFGRKEGFGGRRIVLTQYTHDNQERNYQVVPEEDMKRMLFGWVAEKATLPTPFNTMTIVLCAHGANGLTYKHRGVVLAAGAVLLGWTPQLSTIEPDELLSQFLRVPPSVQINLILLQCFSSAWVERSLLLSPHRNLFVHASCGQAEVSCSLCSVSNEFRCSLFASSIVEAINLNPQGTVATYEVNVQHAMQEAIEHPSHPTSPRHTAVLSVVPNPSLQRPIGELLGFPSRLPNLLVYARRAYQAASAWIRPQPPPLLPFTLDTVVVEQIYGSVVGVSFQDTALWSLMGSYIRGSPTNWRTNAYQLEEIINYRRKSQTIMVLLVQAWEKEGIIQLSTRAGVNLTSIYPATSHNYRLLVHHIPELGALTDYQHETGERFHFSDPNLWIANILGQRLINGKLPSLPLVLSIAARQFGFYLSLSPHPVFTTFEPVLGNHGHPNTVHTIDNFLPVNVEEIRNFEVPANLRLVSGLDKRNAEAGPEI